MAPIHRRVLLSAAALSGLADAARAQAGFPARPIRVVIPFAPGGGTDNLVRTIEPLVSRSLGQPLVIENRPGAGSTVGTEIVARAEPDGYTLLALDSTFTINPALMPRLPYDSARDFAPVSLLANAPIVLVVHPAVQARTIQELVALARAQPGRLSFASGGNGAPTHLAGEMLKAAAGVDITHLPYRGSGPAMNDVIAGHVPMTFNGLSAAGPQIREGRVRALAVTGPRRAAAFPDIPTFAESGLGDVDVYTHWGVLTRAGTPVPVIARLSQAFAQAVNAPELAERLGAMGFVPAPGTPEAYAETIARETSRFGAIIRAANIRPD
ncbi:MAG TPA: tripartite tricarboxylate transporter substrate binding protein [Acetobacteraceae bacterium]|nr:tripartite tricarboxylate transporter substrate binding protein [Acetobacteraceae bacterium]